jgi:predicted RNase H-like nuclease (RuvC/YqgF family)
MCSLNTVTILENANAELRRELLSNKQNITKLYENIKRLNEKYPNLKITIRQVDDDWRMLDEIDNFCRDLVSKRVL